MITRWGASVVRCSVFMANRKGADECRRALLHGVFSHVMEGARRRLDRQTVGRVALAERALRLQHCTVPRVL